MPTRRGVLGAIGAVATGAVAGCGGTVIGGEPIEFDVDFREVSEEWGFRYEATRQTVGPTPAGVFVNDFDDDGYPDVFVTGGQDVKLFENRDGEFVESEALPEIPIDNVDFGLFFDHDNSGWDDLLLIPRSGRPIFLENRAGEFREATVGLEVELDVGTAATAADCTKNGYPDVLILQNGDWTKNNPGVTRDDDDGVVRGGRNLLFHNDGGSFRLVEDAGLDRARWSLATSFADFTGDGYPDVHVANDFGYDSLYLNRGDGTFEGTDLPDTNRHGMASAVADLRRNGYLDVFVTNIRFENPDRFHLDETSKTVNNDGNNLLLNRGDGEFEDRGEEYGVDTGYWGWAAVAADFTNNGYYDLVHTTQTLEYYAEGAWREAKFAPRLWLGDEDGFALQQPREIGFEETDGRGLAWLDVDRDGRCDLVLGNLDGGFKLYENTSSSGHWLQIALHGRPDQTVIGTEVTVSAGGADYYKQAHVQSDYLAQSSNVLHFGLGRAESVEEVSITWPNGEARTLTDVDVDRRLDVEM